MRWHDRDRLIINFIFFQRTDLNGEVRTPILPIPVVAASVSTLVLRIVTCKSAYRVKYEV